MDGWINEWTHIYHIFISCSLPPNYPCVPPVFEIETNKSGSFTFSEADNLYDQLMQTAITRLGSTMIYDLITMSQDYMQEIIKKKKENISSQEIREDRTIRTETETTETETKTIVTGTGAEQNEVIIKEYDYYRPKQFVGSISDIISRLPSNVQITRVSVVMAMLLWQWLPWQPLLVIYMLLIPIK